MSDDRDGPIDLSVIIPTYNRLWCLPLAVESCRRLGCSAEIIVVDDGSTDGTWDWLQSQPDVVALRQPNRGKDWAIASAMRRARGRYVKYLDSDDALITETIAPQVALADDTSADVVTAGMLMVDVAGNVLRRTEYASTDDFLAQQLGGVDQSHYSAFLFRRAFIDDIPHRQEFGSLDDRMFMIEVAMRAPYVVPMNGQTLRHLDHDNERLQNAEGIAHVARTFDQLRVYRSAIAQLVRRGDLTPKRAAAAADVLWHVAHSMARTHADDACEVVAWIQRLNPSFVPPVRGVLGTCFRRLGFRRTQRILRLRRHLIAPARRPARPSTLTFPN